MKVKTRNNIWAVIEFFVILMLLLIRIFANAENWEWVNLVNYFGFLVALWALFIRLHGVCSNNRQVNFVIGVSVVIFLVAIGIGILFLTGIILVTAKTNDVILLLTLIFSLPVQLYEEILKKMLK